MISRYVGYANITCQYLKSAKNLLMRNFIMGS